MRSLLALFVVAAGVAAVGVIFGRPDAGPTFPDPMESDGSIISMAPECDGCKRGTCKLSGYRQARPAGERCTAAEGDGGPP